MMLTILILVCATNVLLASFAAMTGAAWAVWIYTFSGLTCGFGLGVEYAISLIGRDASTASAGLPSRPSTTRNDLAARESVHTGGGQSSPGLSTRAGRSGNTLSQVREQSEAARRIRHANNWS